MDSTHPGCSEIIAVKGLSVQGQDKYPCRTAVDQRGEQTINQDAKTSGGMKYFASDPSSILKWTLNRSTQARNTQALYDLADVNCSEDVYKALLPSHILKSEQLVEKLIHLMTDEFLNPFDESLDSGELYNLSSGIPVAKEMVDQILGVKEVGQICYQNFLQTRLRKNDNKIRDPIKRQKLVLFKNTGKKVLVHQQQKQKVIEMNRNILEHFWHIQRKMRGLST